MNPRGLTQTRPVLGLVLAGGQSRRMGGYPKGLMPWTSGQLLIDAVLDRLRPQCELIGINLAAEHPDYALRADSLLDTPQWRGAGPLAGAEVGLRWLNGQSVTCVPRRKGNAQPAERSSQNCTANPRTHCLIVCDCAPAQRPEWLAISACDIPLQPKNWVHELLTVCERANRPLAWAIDGQGRDHPTLAVLRRSLWPEVERLLETGERRVRVAWSALGGLGVQLPDLTDALPNLNTPEALAAARHAAQSAEQ